MESNEGKDDVAKVMGFAGFGGEKKAKQFDFMAMFEQTRRTAMERSQKNLKEREQEYKQGLSKSSAQTKKSSDDEDDDMIGPPVPKQNDKDEEEDSDDDMIGPPLPPTMKSSQKQTTDEAESGEEEEEETDLPPENLIPNSHEIVLEHGSKTVSALALDPSGARLVAGGFDYEVKFWDFAGMDANLQSFRSIQPCECHQIKSLEYSSTGDMILVVAGNAQAKVFDRDGFEIMECPKGDQYIVDMASTRGHAAMLNAGCWHPKIKDEFMTCSNDGTVRLWDVNNDYKHKNVIKPKSQVGRKTIPTACTFSKDGNFVAAACQDGSIQMWDHRKNYVNVAMMNRTAHMNGTDTSSLCFSYDGKCLASRGGDDTLKLWDVRNFKKPLQVAQDLFNRFPMTDCVFSPDDKMVVTGVSVKKHDTDGNLLFFDRETMDQLALMKVSDSNVVRCIWHPKLNQIVVGCGDGKVKLYYDPEKSHRGAKLCVVKTKRKVQQVEAMTATHVITPHALPMFRQKRQKATARQKEKDRSDPVLSKRPDLPITGVGSGGRVGAHGSTLSQYVAKQIVLRKWDERDKDPRAAILRHAEEAKKNPYWVDPAYKDQPQHVLHHQVEDDSEDEDDEGPMWKKQKNKE